MRVPAWTTSLALVGILGLTGTAWLGSLDTEANERARTALLTVDRQNGELRTLVLASNTGVLRRYDPIVELAFDMSREVDALDGRMQAAVGDLPGLARAHQALEERIRLDARTIDQFKSEAAIRKNSLRYLPEAARDLRAALAGHPERVEEVDELTRLALAAQVAGDPESVHRLTAALDLADRQGGELAGDVALDRTLFLGHIRRSVEQDRILESLLGQLLTTETNDTVQDLRRSYREAWQDVERRAALARQATFGFAALLVLVLFHRGRELRAVYASLERRVLERTQDLVLQRAELQRAGRAMRLILDNVEQGLVTVRLDGTPSSERSAMMERWLGPPADTFWSWLAQHDPTLGSWLEIGFEDLREGLLPYEVVLAQWPTHLEIGERHLQLTYAPVLGDDRMLTAVLVVLTDRTSEVEQQRLEEVNRETLRVFQALSADRSGFVQFRDEADRLLARLGAGLDPAQAKRIVHTIKGNSAVFGLEGLSRVCHDVESRIVERGRVLDADVAAIQDSWWRVVDRIRPFLGDADVLRVPRGRIDELQHAINRGEGHDRLCRQVKDWFREPTAARLAHLAEQAERVAEHLGKEVVVEVVGNGIRLGERWGPFWTASIHVLRNALDHGIEAPEEREAAGKKRQGRLRLVTRRIDQRLEILVEDDGRGIDWDAIREKARRTGLPTASHGDLVRALFADGLSSREVVSETSGRGVGLGAVEEIVASMNGRIDVESEPGRGTRFVFAFRGVFENHLPAQREQRSGLARA